jgi:metal-sulfur cluster biosynthetic enzyme
MPSFRLFHVHSANCSHGADPAKEEVMTALSEVRDEKGKSLQELGMLHSLEVKEGTVTIKLNLTSDYRKIKNLV